MGHAVLAARPHRQVENEEAGMRTGFALVLAIGLFASCDGIQPTPTQPTPEQPALTPLCYGDYVLVVVA
jgi:hypothetical protein